MLLLKYLNREVIHTMLAVVIILLLIVMSNMFVRYLSMAAGGSFAGMTVFKFIGVLLPKYIAYLLPISFFFSILMVYGKMFANNELMVVFSCGSSWMRLLRITLLPAIVIFVIECFLTLTVVPYMVQNFNILKQTAGQSSPIEFLQPGKIMAFKNQMIYVESVNNKTNQMKNIFIYSQNQNKPDAKPIIITAPTGYPEHKPNGSQYLVLKNGHYYQGDPGSLAYQTGSFEEATQYIKGNYIRPAQLDLESMPLFQLLEQNSAEASAEFQWRFSFPLAVFVTMLIAIAVCRISPRQGRYGKIIPAVLIFIAYFNLISMARGWLGNGDIPSWIGIWWVHLLFAGLALFFIRRMNGPIFNNYLIKRSE